LGGRGRPVRPHMYTPLPPRPTPAGGTHRGVAGPGLRLASPSVASPAVASLLDVISTSVGGRRTKHPFASPHGREGGERGPAPGARSGRHGKWAAGAPEQPTVRESCRHSGAPWTQLRETVAASQGPRHPSGGRGGAAAEPKMVVGEMERHVDMDTAPGGIGGVFNGEGKTKPTTTIAPSPPGHGTCCASPAAGDLRRWGGNGRRR